MNLVDKDSSRNSDSIPPGTAEGLRKKAEVVALAKEFRENGGSY
jgi:hypothetical protein